MGQLITVSTRLAYPIDLVWHKWTTPEHIMHWNAASDDWHCPAATNDLRPGGRFVYHMAARDGSMGFDFSGVYSAVDTPHLIGITLDDGRSMIVKFSEKEGITTVIEEFEAETENSIELQKLGWQAILDRFQHYVENINE